MSTEEQTIEMFLEMLCAERGSAANTISAYRRDLEDFRNFLRRRERLIVAATPPDISAYVAEASASGLKATSLARRLSAVRQLYKFLVAEGQVRADPTLGQAAPRKERALPKTLNVAARAIGARTHSRKSRGYSKTPKRVVTWFMVGMRSAVTQGRGSQPA